MSRQRRTNTSPEILLRRELHRRGLRFRVHLAVPGLPRRSIDIAFTRVRVAVFVDGCFWHACPQHATWPVANESWWREKLKANADRDRATTRALEEAGWIVVRVWEHEPMAEAAEAVEAALRSRRAFLT